MVHLELCLLGCFGDSEAWLACGLETDEPIEILRLFEVHHREQQAAENPEITIARVECIDSLDEVEVAPLGVGDCHVDVVTGFCMNARDRIRMNGRSEATEQNDRPVVDLRGGLNQDAWGASLAKCRQHLALLEPGHRHIEDR